ncbi:NUDIX hydrolase [Lichenihabitans psoromatis]|uniref:NUDIX hydrolase n=1 Tax=Lichenihabitans psoromatis TaxID=2528642 RepID=UPI0010384F59|nr:NUDIX hydrolase [Lichenihabitans psoromatis]
MSRPKGSLHRQYGAVPFRFDQDGFLEVMLVTSRDTGRWIVPKGWPIAKLKPRQVAAREAWEEAGLKGRIVGTKALGRFRYMKAIEDEQPIECELTLFALQVSKQSKSWPERRQRKTEWFGVDAAIALASDPGLRKILMDLPASLMRMLSTAPIRTLAAKPKRKSDLASA